jgi:hypothetical protein
MILNGSAHVSCVFEFEKNNKQSLKIDPGTQKKKLGMLNVIKQLQHFILCNMMCYGAPSALVNIAFQYSCQCSITHHIALNEVQ